MIEVSLIGIFYILPMLIAFISIFNDSNFYSKCSVDNVVVSLMIIFIPIINVIWCLCFAIGEGLDSYDPILKIKWRTDED